MLPRIDTPGPKAPGAVTPATAPLQTNDARQQAFQRAMANLVGQPLKGAVLSKFADGSFLVKVADTSARMMLPAGVQVGAEVPMTLISVTPRPTFQIGTGQGNQPAPVFADAGDGAEPGQTATLPSQTPQAGTLPGRGATPTLAQPPAAAPDQAADGQPVPGKAGLPLPAGTTPAPAPQPGTLPAAVPNNGAAGLPLPSGAPAADGGQAVRPQSMAAILLGRAPLTPADQLPDLDHATLPATLSPAARAIASALSTAYSAPGVPVTINGKTPLVAGGRPDAEQLTHSLKNALGQSGLFYESHVAEWVEGKRTMPELLREPQMQRAAQAPPQGASETLARAMAGPDLAAAQMINQQLHTQEQQRVQWNGQAWPGQPMEWDVRRDERERQQQPGQENGQEREAVWRSGVRFRFPMLGKVSAAVTLVGDQVHIQMQTDSDDSAATLRAWSGQLQSAMEAAGAPLASLTIAGDGAADSGAVAATGGVDVV